MNTLLVLIDFHGHPDFTTDPTTDIVRYSNLTNIIFSNRSYAILKVELDRVGALGTGERAASMFSLDDPAISWPSLAESLGVTGYNTTTVEEFKKALSESLASEGPSLIEVVI